jgi:hypothetical protein
MSPPENIVDGIKVFRADDCPVGAEASGASTVRAKSRPAPNGRTSEKLNHARSPASD